MTDKEILAELKRCYEFLYDIRENGCIDHCGGQIQYDLIKKLEDAKSSVEEVYSNFYKTLNKEDLRVKNIEYKTHGEKAYISSEASGDYEVGEENWNMNCADLDYYWYEDEDFLEDYEEEEEDYE